MRGGAGSPKVLVNSLAGGLRSQQETDRYIDRYAIQRKFAYRAYFVSYRGEAKRKGGGDVPM